MEPIRGLSIFADFGEIKGGIALSRHTLAIKRATGLTLSTLGSPCSSAAHHEAMKLLVLLVCREYPSHSDGARLG